LDGFLNVDKPLGMTSSHAVVMIRHALEKGTAIGHGGTLDPEASGILPVCVGRATRLFDYIVEKQKTYLAEIQLGAQTDTQDATGQVVATSPVKAGWREIAAVLPRFMGDIMQVPPMYSAIKQNGKRLYQLARQGQTARVEARLCRVDAIRLLKQTGPDRYALEITCQKGVYIRTICHDIGLALGCFAHMHSLRRVQAGMFRLKNALSPETIVEMLKQGRGEEIIIPMDAPIAHLPKVHVGKEHLHAVKNGNTLKPQWLSRRCNADESVLRIYMEDEFAGIGAALPDGSVRFRAMLLREVEHADTAQ